MATRHSERADEFRLEPARLKPISLASANVRAGGDRRHARFNVNPWLVLALLVLLVVLVL
ncbi:MAG TPA: hypothetical protein VMT19_12000 [Thermoanaerobaculaceae bacterium]|nr:hypothetical protein [Thermoanaerobaculaceae bacterium]